jgi:hypothetical protein
MKASPKKPIKEERVQESQHITSGAGRQAPQRLLNRGWFEALSTGAREERHNHRLTSRLIAELYRKFRRHLSKISATSALAHCRIGNKVAS